MKIEKCPYHNIDPEYTIDIYRKELIKYYTDTDGVRKTIVYPQLANHYWYCPECKKSMVNGTANGHAAAKLGRGYYSSESKEKALANWNNGISNLIPAIIRAAVNGKNA